MGWQAVATPGPLMKFYAQGGCVRWNDAAQKLMGYPERVDLCFDEETQQMAFRMGGQYMVGLTDDELRYEVYMPDALELIGFEITEDYEVVPELVDHGEGEISGMVGAIWVPMPE